MTGSMPELRRVVALFTRDLRLHDNPALDLACRQAAEVIPVFVLDPALSLVARGRVSFLLDCLTDLRAGLRRQGGDLAGAATSRLSADLHFGTVSPLELAVAAAGLPGGEAFVRQLCWRDFHAQVTAAFPDIATRDYRPRRDDWRDDPQAYQAWCAGQTGIPIIDAGMRQLAAEGFMHNRARMLVAAALTRQLRIHWTAGARHFSGYLVDGDIASNAGNWQWAAGTGNDTRPGRRFNLLRQARRFDAAADYVRRYVPELAAVPGPEVHQPWRLPTVRYHKPLAALWAPPPGVR